MSRCQPQDRASASRPRSGPGERTGRSVQASARSCCSTRSMPAAASMAADRTAQPGRRLRARRAARDNTRKLIEEGVFALFGYVGTPTSLAALPLVNAAKIPFVAPVHRRGGPAHAVQPLRVPRARLVLRRDRRDRQAAHRGGHQAHRGVLPERQLRPGRTRGRDPRAQAARAGAGGPRHGRAQHGRRRRRGEGHPGAASPMPSCRSAPTSPAPRSSARRARRASAARSTTSRSSARRRWPRNSGADARGVVVSQVMPFPFAPITALAGEYLAAGRAASAEFDPNYSSMEGYVAAKTLVEGLRRAGTQPHAGGPDHRPRIAARLSTWAASSSTFAAQKHAGSKYVDMTILTADGQRATLISCSVRGSIRDRSMLPPVGARGPAFCPECRCRAASCRRTWRWRAPAAQ